MHVSAGVGEKGAYNFISAHHKKHNKHTHTDTQTHTHTHNIWQEWHEKMIFQKGPSKLTQSYLVSDPWSSLSTTTPKRP